MRLDQITWLMSKNTTALEFLHKSCRITEHPIALDPSLESQTGRELLLFRCKNSFQTSISLPPVNLRR